LITYFTGQKTRFKINIAPRERDGFFDNNKEKQFFFFGVVLELFFPWPKVIFALT
jgi:hypothetical protein